MKKSKLARARTAMHAARHGENQARDNYQRVKANYGALRHAHELLHRRCELLERDAARYRWLRSRDVSSIQRGGVFAGMTPQNVVLSEADLDRAVDKAMRIAA